MILRRPHRHRSLILAAVAQAALATFTVPAAACDKCKLGVAALLEDDAALTLMTKAGSHTSQAAGDGLGDTPAPLAEMASSGGAAPSANPSSAYTFSVTGGADFTTAYFHRGYLMGDTGAIVQPHLTLALTPTRKSDFSITPYVSIWSSFQEAGTTTSGQSDGTAASASGAVAPMFCCPFTPSTASAKTSTPGVVRLASTASTPASAAASGSGRGSDFGWYECELMAGVVASAGPLSIDIKYTAYVYPGGDLTTTQEIGAKVSYDLASFWREPGAHHDFVLRPYIQYDIQVAGENRGTYQYLELGIEPSLAFHIGKTRVGLSVPIAVGMSVDGFYTSLAGSNDTIGFMSIGLKATVPLPMPEKFGKWYLTGTLTYLDLASDSLRTLNGGERREIIGTVGVSFAL